MSGTAQISNAGSPVAASANSIVLPSTVAIGFTGHRNLPDESKSRACILKFLQEYKSGTNKIVYGVSSAAAGGDLLFAESCLQIGLPIRILLPVSKEQFREDFDEPTWNRAELVMQRAFSVEVIGSGDTKEERYYECGVETVQQSQMLLALWDGKPSHGLGGTADVFAFAKDQERPVVWIHSVSGDVQHFHPEKESFIDPELDFLNGLPDSGATPDFKMPFALVQNWFLKIDISASHAAPQLRRLAAIPILCTAGAAICTAAFAFSDNSGALVGIGAGLGLMTSGLPMAMRLNARQVRWTRIRTAAEICRSVLALWRTPGPYEAIGPEIIPDLTGTLASLNFLKMSDSTAGGTRLEDFRKTYREERIQNQIVYFSKNAGHSDRKTRQYKRTVMIAVLVGLSMNLWMLLGSYWLKNRFGGWLNGIAFAGIVFFQIATIAGALLVVNDWQRRRERYRELHDLLVVWDKQIAAARTWSTVLSIATRVEKALLAEVIEWRSLIRNRKLPRK
jgi:hypothetical protein